MPARSSMGETNEARWPKDDCGLHVRILERRDWLVVAKFCTTAATRLVDLLALALRHARCTPGSFRREGERMSGEGTYRVVDAKGKPVSGRVEARSLCEAHWLRGFLDGAEGENGPHEVEELVSEWRPVSRG